MRTGWSAIGILLVLIAVPTASACSLAGEPEDPARFYIWDLDLGRIVADTVVEERRLGGMCELSTVYDLEHGTLAWPDSRPGIGPGILLWDFLGDEAPRKVSDGEIRYGWQVDLVDDHVVHHSRYFRDAEGDDTEENRYNEFRTIHMESGEERTLPVEGQDMHGIIIQDGHIHWYERTEGGFTLSIYDAISEAYHLEDVPFTAFGVPAKARLVTANGHWLVFYHSEGVHDDRTYSAWAYPTGGHNEGGTIVPDPSRLQDLPDPEDWRHAALDGDSAFYLGTSDSGTTGLIEYDLRAEETVDRHPVPDLPRTSVFRMSDGRTVYGAYSSEGPPQDVETTGGQERPTKTLVTHPVPDDDDKTVTLPALGPLSFVLLVAGLFLRRRR